MQDQGFCGKVAVCSRGGLHRATRLSSGINVSTAARRAKFCLKTGANTAAAALKPPRSETWCLYTLCKRLSGVYGACVSGGSRLARWTFFFVLAPFLPTPRSDDFLPEIFAAQPHRLATSLTTH